MTAVDPLTRPRPRPGGRPGPGARPLRSAALRGRLRHNRRPAAVTVGLAAACFVVLCVSVSLGRIHIPALDVARAVVGLDAGPYDAVINRIRLPRAVVGLLAGAAFGMSGAIFQAIARNPLATPDMIGVTAGASAAAVAAIVTFGLRGYPVSVAAFAGALATVVAMYLLAWRGGVAGHRLVLVGIALNAMLTSVVSYFLTRSDVHDARDALSWITGSLNATSWATVRPLAVIVVVLVPAALLASRQLAVLRLGDDVARALGMRVTLARTSLIVIATGLAAAATAAVGPVAFVALMSGPAARRLTGDSTAALLPSALVGALVVTLADLAGQHAVPSQQFPVGVATSVVGAPYLLWLLTAGARGNRHG